MILNSEAEIIRYKYVWQILYHMSTTIYTLKLENDKYYVGKSDAPEKILEKQWLFDLMDRKIVYVRII